MFELLRYWLPWQTVLSVLEAAALTLFLPQKFLLSKRSKYFLAIIELCFFQRFLGIFRKGKSDISKTTTSLAT